MISSNRSAPNGQGFGQSVLYPDFDDYSTLEMFAHTRFSAFVLILLLSQKIGTFDQAKYLIFFYDSFEEPQP